MTTTPLQGALSVDVEDWFQVSSFEEAHPRETWADMDWRVADSTRRLLDLFAKHGVQATFFTLGCVAERFPELIREIVDGGHELASHGYEHRRVSSLDAESFRADLARAKTALQAEAEVPIVGFRAPSFSITPDCLWAFDVLREEGYTFSSSVFPVKHDHYGLPQFPRHPVQLAGADGSSLWEFPMTTWRALGRNWPVAGGGWMRALPPAFMRRALRSELKRGTPVITYLHPWEVDPEQPRTRGGSRKQRFRHYLNLEKMLPRLEALIQAFRFGTVSQVLAQWEAGAADGPSVLDRQALEAVAR